MKLEKTDKQDPPNRISLLKFKDLLFSTIPLKDCINKFGPIFAEAMKVWKHNRNFVQMGGRLAQQHIDPS